MTYQHTRFRYANQAVGVFVTLTIIVFLAAFFFSGQIREWFDPGERIKIILPSDGLYGLAEGAEVDIIGTKSGKVLQIIINPDQQMHANVRIQSDMKAFVRRDSKAVIRKRFGVAGDSYLEISRGLGEPLDWKYAVIDASAERAPTDTIGDVLDEVRTKIFPVIDDTQKAINMLLALVQDFHAPEGNMQTLLDNLNTVSGKMARGEGTVGRLLADEKMVDDFQELVNRLSQSIERVNPLFDELGTTIGNVSKITDQISRQSRDLPEITLKLKEVLVSVQAVMEDISRSTPQLPRIAKNLSAATNNVPVLMLQTQQVMAELEQLIKQLQSHWLLGRQEGQKQPANTRISPLEVRP
jgi:phospholipid/cholesterol/gamma-HCH transport system substrate-binding protein